MPERLRYIIHKSIDLKYHPDQNEGIIILQDESNAQKIKSRLEEILKENTIQDFVITENTEKQNEITLLKKGDIEQLGIYLCTHCGVAFGSEIQRTVHQRIHYFGWLCFPGFAVFELDYGDTSHPLMLWFWAIKLVYFDVRIQIVLMSCYDLCKIHNLAKSRRIFSNRMS